MCALFSGSTQRLECVSKASPPMETRRLRAATVSKSFKVERPGKSKNRPVSARSPFSLDYILASLLRGKIVLQPVNTFPFFGEKDLECDARIWELLCSRLARFADIIKISERSSSKPFFWLLKILLTGVQLFIAPGGVRHWVVAGTVFSGDRLKWLG